MNEQTHPPFGKLLLSAGMLLFGETPFGWRFMTAVFGVLMVPLLYLLLWELFGQTYFAVWGSCLFLADFLHFTLSRIGTPDTCIAFLILLQFTLMFRLLGRLQKYRRPEFLRLLLCAAVCGISVAVKWTGVFATAGVFLLFLVFFFLPENRQQTTLRRQMLLCGTAAFVLLPAVLYVLSYLPFYQVMGYRDALTAAADKAFQMWKFHKDITFSHPGASAWYTWPLDLTPLIDTVDTAGGGLVSCVATFGNPFVWWGGLVSFFVLAYRSVYRKDVTASGLCIAYLSLLVPWMLIRRTVFIYQYYGCSLIQIAMLTYMAALLPEKYRKWANVYLCSAGILFVLFYPVLSGTAVPAGYIRHILEWLPAWQFAGRAG